MLYFFMVPSCSEACLFFGDDLLRLWLQTVQYDLRKKIFEPEGAEKYKELNYNIKRCMKRAKENWIGKQCSEIAENLRKNNSKRAYELVKDLTTVKQGEVTTVQDRSGKCLTEEREILNRWTGYCTELYNHKANGDP